MDVVRTLKEINRVSKLGSILILSTDNLSRFHSLISILKGKSPNVPLLDGSLFYDGDWRVNTCKTGTTCITYM